MTGCSCGVPTVRRSDASVPSARLKLLPECSRRALAWDTVIVSRDRGLEKPYYSVVAREPRSLTGPARERALRRRLGAALLFLGLLLPFGTIVIALASGFLAGPRAAAGVYVILAVTALAAGGVSMALSRRIAERFARLEEREARVRTAFEAASLASSLAESAWLSRLEEEERRVSERASQWREENAELEGFAYAISHNLRAPLRHVNAFVSMLRRHAAGGLDAQSEHYLDAIGAASDRMGVLVEDLLSFVRMRHAELVRTPVDVSALVRELITDFGPQTAGRDVDWNVGQLPALDADPSLLRRALANLLSNALKFTRPRTHAVIEVGGSVAPGGAEVVLFVGDNGVGFDPRYASKLFQVFQRLHAADEFEGTGIGLATVRRIVERHGGSVWANSELGRGATFFVSFPREATPPAPRPPGSERAAGAAGNVAHRLLRSTEIPASRSSFARANRQAPPSSIGT
jgi:signal transduction histidine kinase